MAEAFQPTFVDLVCNYTTTTGTGNFKLGPAASGFTSFASALRPGDTFYYSAIGIDKPGEREVGRGTLQADGTILRDPIGGTATSFTGGTKTVALVAAAEWYRSIQAGGNGSALAYVATRAALAATSQTQAPLFLSEEGRQGLFAFSSANLTAQVAADTAQGIHIAPGSDATGASGAWVRQFKGAVDPKWFGVLAANSGAANDAAWCAMAAALRAIATAGYQARSLSTIRFTDDHIYNFNSTIEFTDGSFIIEGVSTPTDDGGTCLKFPGGVTGIRVQRFNTSGASDVRTPTGDGGDRSLIRNLRLDGAYGGTESEAHGIHMRAAAIVENVIISDFEGDGVHVYAVAGGGAGSEGNANNFEVRYVRAIRNRNGFFADGADANAGRFVHCDASANRGWGFYDSSFLGNTYDACHSAANGRIAGATPTACSYSGNQYYVKAGQAAGAAINAPSGTTADNNYWGYIGAGGAAGTIPLWLSGTVFREGGAYKTDDANARNLLLNCYSEGGQNPAQFVNRTLVLHGLHGAGTNSTFKAVLFGDFNGLNAANLVVGDGGLTVNGGLAFGNDSSVLGGPIYRSSATIGASWYKGGAFCAANAVDSFQFSWQHIAAHAFQVGPRFGAVTIAKVDSAGFKVSAATAALGYGSGAGGSVVQAISKATDVTLAKPCGQIVMAADSLAAGASASFWLTNSQIAASDTILVSLSTTGVTDASAYSVRAAAQAGKARVTIRNESGAVLSEAVTVNFAVLKAVAA